MIVKLLTEQHLEFLSLKGGCRGSSESTHVKMPHCWKSHAMAHLVAVSRGNQCLLVFLNVETVRTARIWDETGRKPELTMTEEISHQNAHANV